MSDDPDPDEARRVALLALLAAGLKPEPARSVLVSALAGARRTVSSYQTRGEPLDDWLTSEMKLRGIRENAAVLAALEVPAYRESVARMYRELHPDRTVELDDFLQYLESFPTS